MKNLNKKIGVVVLSGLVLAGSGLASSASAYYPSGNGGVVIKDVWYAKDPRVKSQYQSKWESLKQRAVDEGDLEDILSFGGSAGYNGGYIVKAMSSSNSKKIEVVPYSSPKEVSKYFDNVDSFINHMWEIGMIHGSSQIVNIRGVDYHMEFI